jgi:hypothetical protein
MLKQTFKKEIINLVFLPIRRGYRVAGVPSIFDDDDLTAIRERDTRTKE